MTILLFPAGSKLICCFLMTMKMSVMRRREPHNHSGSVGGSSGADAGVRRCSPLLICHQSASVDSRWSTACYERRWWRQQWCSPRSVCQFIMRWHQSVSLSVSPSRTGSKPTGGYDELPKEGSIIVCFSRLAPPPQVLRR